PLHPSAPLPLRPSAPPPLHPSAPPKLRHSTLLPLRNSATPSPSAPLPPHPSVPPLPLRHSAPTPLHPDAPTTLHPYVEGQREASLDPEAKQLPPWPPAVVGTVPSSETPTRKVDTLWQLLGPEAAPLAACCETYSSTG
ncbi:hypothetical protein Vafri_1364, partial [Volvox africanus]